MPSDLPQIETVEIQTGPDPADTITVIVIGDSPGTDMAIRALARMRSPALVVPDLLARAALDVLEVFDVRPSTVKPERKPTKAEWRRQMKGAR